ncbi:MAG: hypothetical protein FWC03_04460 [Treponema sp.]|nr:hypothetical protein [Treponema sp.]
MIKQDMLNTALQFETLNPEVLSYIRKLETDNKRIIELESFKHKYYELNERYDLLIYKRFCRSAEELLSDDKQQSLFVEETEQTELPEEGIETEKQKIKSYTGKKPGRKPLDPNLRRVEEIVDIPEDEKTCACGEKMTRIGEET